MRYEHELRLLVLQSDRRILAATPAEGFLAPTHASVVSAEGVRHFHPSDWFEVSWTGDAPRGFTAQTCYLFRWTEAGRIEDVSRTERHDPVVL